MESINLYLSYERDSIGAFELQLLPESKAKRHDILYIPDAVPPKLERWWCYFVVPRCPTIIKQSAVAASAIKYRIFNFTDPNDSAEILRLFDEKFPCFELCSPGFTHIEDCKDWWVCRMRQNKRSNSDKHRRLLWKSHIILAIKHY